LTSLKNNLVGAFCDLLVHEQKGSAELHFTRDSPGYFLRSDVEEIFDDIAYKVPCVAQREEIRAAAFAQALARMAQREADARTT
jgi:hypothetical protein